VQPPILPKPPADDHQHRHSIYAAEATGLLLMAVVLLVVVVMQHWRYISWSAR